MKVKSFIALVLLLAAASAVSAQGTPFNYQGSLNTGGSPANGNHDFEFALFDALAGGAQVGATLPRNAVAVANGSFAVSLDFGNQFPGADRFLEIRVRVSGGGALTPLAPRQPLTSAPYAIKSLDATTATNATNATTAATATNALNLGGVVAAQYVVTTDPRMADARNPLPTSPNYIWNQNSVLQPSSNFVISGNGFVGGTLEASTVLVYGLGSSGDTSLCRNAGNQIATCSVASVLPGSGNYIQNGVGQQAASNFNISGNGTASGTLRGNIVTATTQYNIGGNRVLSVAGTVNTFLGVNAGPVNTGINNSFFGRAAGLNNTLGNDNSFSGFVAGEANTIGINNSFFGSFAGQNNADGNDNSFFGRAAGQSNTDGNENAFFGRSAGRLNTADSNSFFGAFAGAVNTAGSNNSFFGRAAGLNNTLGSNNSFYGNAAGEANATGDRNSFFGNAAGRANDTGSSNSFFGYTAGISQNTGCCNAYFGAFAGDSTTEGGSNSFFGTNAGSFNNLGSFNSFFGRSAGDSNTTGDNNTIIGNLADVASGNLTFATAIGAGAVVSTSNTVVLGRDADIVRIPGFLRVVQLGSPGATPLCQNVNFTISTCSSSLRYKSNISRFGFGLSLIQKLKPITFDWKDGGMHDLGLGAEDVAAIEPLLVTYNDKGEIEGVKYDRIGVVLINAVNEQQAQIEAQQKRINALDEIIGNQQREIDALKQKAAEIDALKKIVCTLNSKAEFCK